MKRFLLKKIYFILYFLSPYLASAQEVIYNNFNLDSIGIGEQIQLNIILESENPDLIDSISLENILNIKVFSQVPGTDSISSKAADATILSYGKWKDSSGDGILTGVEIGWEKNEEGDEPYYYNSILISFFDLGVHVFEGFDLKLGAQSMTTNVAMVPVVLRQYNLAVVDSTGLAPIKDILREPLKFIDFLPILLILAGVIAIVTIVYIIFKRKNNKEVKTEEKEAIYIPPDVNALAQLKELRSKKLWQKGKIKDYQSELTRIIREYIEKRYEILALESTTRQILDQIKEFNIGLQNIEMLKRILQIADLVKFAKAKPEEDIHETFMADAIQFVQQTKEKFITEEEE